jgi:hypothetical protein
MGSAARFSAPEGLAVDGAGNVFVADSDNETIREITPAGVVTTLAGMAGQVGSVDGEGGAARFNDPEGIAVDGMGNVYVADTFNNTIRKGLAASSSPGLATSISTRAFAGTGDNILIGGFYIVGSTSRTVLVQALGPALAPLGVSGALQHPMLSIHQTQNGHDITLYTNTGWGGSQVLLDAAAAVFATPALAQGSADSELLVTLPPGGYSAEVSGADGGTGVALCAIYELP